MECHTFAWIIYEKVEIILFCGTSLFYEINYEWDVRVVKSFPPLFDSIHDIFFLKVGHVSSPYPRPKF